MKRALTEESMSRFTKDSKFRLRDFRRRKNYSPDSVYVHPMENYEYIPVHPFSDESDILEDLRMEPIECKTVDAWWNMHSDMCLLSVTTAREESNKEIGLYASWPKQKQGYLYFMAVLDSDRISKVSFQNVMAQISEYNLIASEKVRSKLSGKMSYVGKIS